MLKCDEHMRQGMIIISELRILNDQQMSHWFMVEHRQYISYIYMLIFILLCDIDRFVDFSAVHVGILPSVRKVLTHLG